MEMSQGTVVIYPGIRLKIIYWNDRKSKIYSCFQCENCLEESKDQLYKGCRKRQCFQKRKHEILCASMANDKGEREENCASTYLLLPNELKKSNITAMVFFSLDLKDSSSGICCLCWSIKRGKNKDVETSAFRSLLKNNYAIPCEKHLLKRLLSTHHIERSHLRKI